MPLRKEQVMINTILDVNGITIGQAHDDEVRTGVTVVLPDKPANCSVDVRGGGPGTREIDALNDGGLIDKVHAICLSGGSVYGLAAADGVCAWLGEKRLGYEVGPSPIPVSPIVPKPCASSTKRRKLYFPDFLNSTISFNLPWSPAIPKTPSVITRIPPFCSSAILVARSICLSKLSMSLCLKT